MSIYLIRHGETEWSLTGRHTGHTDIPLTVHGEDEARRIEPRLRSLAFSHVFTSPRQRARRTCQLAKLDSDAVVDATLSEWDYGDYEGQRSPDIRNERPGWNLYHDGCPKGEKPQEVSTRADRLIDSLRKLEGNIALFTHGQFGGVLAVRWLGLPLVIAQHFPLGTASLSILGNDPHHPEVPVIALWNESSFGTIPLGHNTP
jgi:probable phosphoglycerate mutase